MLPKEFPGTQESSPSPPHHGEVPAAKGNRRRPGQMDEQSYEPVVPVKVGNRRASARSGHGTHWREGGASGRICRRKHRRDSELEKLCPQNFLSSHDDLLAWTRA